LTGDPAEVISGRASIKGAYFGTDSYSPILTSDPGVIPLLANHTYRVTFKYRIVTTPSRGFTLVFISQKGFSAGSPVPGLTINGKDGETGTATLTTTLGPFDDYFVGWSLIATGAVVIDDIDLVDTGTGQLIASERGESPIVVEQRAPPASGGTLTIVPATLPTLIVGIPVRITLTVTGGTGTGWIFAPNNVGTQIPGLLINSPSPGMLSGTPTAAGPYVRGFTVSDSGGNSGSIVYSGTVLPAGTEPTAAR
jgi:hypothetical protein